MTTEARDPVVQGGPGAGTHADPSVMRYVVQAVVSTLLTLCVLAPVAYVMSRNWPAPMATVDLQMLIEENQKQVMEMLGSPDEASEARREVAEAMTVAFAKKLSASVEALAQDCGCVLINKAALLGGQALDYTDLLRERLK